MKNPIIAVIAVIGVILLVAWMPSFMSGVEDTQTTEISDSYNVTTAAGVTNSTVTLSQELFNDDTINIESIVSDGGGGDNPLGSSYTAANKHLLVTGLDAAKTRNITVTYLTDRLTEYSGVGTGMSILPMLGFAAIALLAIGIIYRAFAQR